MLTQNTLKRVSFLFDDLVKIPGTNTRVGIDGIIGLLPVIGDAVGILLSLYLLLSIYQHGVKRNDLFRMIFNILLDAVVGGIPIFGDVFDIWFRSNARNLAIAQKHWEEMTDKEVSPIEIKK